MMTDIAITNGFDFIAFFMLAFSERDALLSASSLVIIGTFPRTFPSSASVSSQTYVPLRTGAVSDF